MTQACWKPCDDGSTIGEKGSENGTIIRDEEYSEGARVTLEKGGTIAPYSITCGVYGWMVHTCFYSTENEASQAFNEIKSNLENIVSLIPLEDDPNLKDKQNLLVDAIEAFVTKY